MASCNCTTDPHGSSASVLRRRGATTAMCWRCWRRSWQSRPTAAAAVSDLELTARRCCRTLQAGRDDSDVLALLAAELAKPPTAEFDDLKGCTRCRRCGAVCLRKRNHGMARAIWASMRCVEVVFPLFHPAVFPRASMQAVTLPTLRPKHACRPPPRKLLAPGDIQSNRASLVLAQGTTAAGGRRSSSTRRKTAARTAPTAATAAARSRCRCRKHASAASAAQRTHASSPG